MPATSQSVFPRLEPLLPTVQKPIQYVGGELNSTVKDWDCALEGPSVRWALMYPDAYEVGLPNQGVQILYEVLNERDWILAERTYSVWPDMERVMREGDALGAIPQFTVDGHRPVGDFDLFGVSFSTELGYTNLLNALDLAGIPLHAVDRNDDHPVVIAGGHAAFNPEPISDFVDAAVLGDGEEIVLAISSDRLCNRTFRAYVLLQWRRDHRGGRGRDPAAVGHEAGVGERRLSGAGGRGRVRSNRGLGDSYWADQSRAHGCRHAGTRRTRARPADPAADPTCIRPLHLRVHRQ